jgi:hypothetical protein
MDTFKFFKNNGFILIYLYGNAPNYEIKLDEIDENEYNLFVPVIDCYEMLSPKMEYAYKYLNGCKCNGILKIDDDITILDENDLKNTLFKAIKSFDYLGIDVGEYVNVPTDVKCSKVTINYLNTITVFNKELEYGSIFKYYAGPLYWISNIALEHICKIGMLYIYEDVSVGYAIHINKSLKVFNMNVKLFYDVIFSVDDKTEY